MADYITWRTRLLEKQPLCKPLEIWPAPITEMPVSCRTWATAHDRDAVSVAGSFMAVWCDPQVQGDVVE